LDQRERIDRNIAWWTIAMMVLFFVAAAVGEVVALRALLRGPERFSQEFAAAAATVMGFMLVLGVVVPYLEAIDDPRRPGPTQGGTEARNGKQPRRGFMSSASNIGVVSIGACALLAVVLIFAL
jgi:hypothetical protein